MRLSGGVNLSKTRILKFEAIIGLISILVLIINREIAEIATNFLTIY